MRARLVSAAPPQVLATPTDRTIAALELRAGAASRPARSSPSSTPRRCAPGCTNARSRREALRLEVAAAADQVRAARTALAEDALAAEAQGIQLAAEQRRAVAAAGLADRECRRRALFEAAGLLSAAEAERSRAEAERLAATAEALSFACWAGGRERRALLDQAHWRNASLLCVIHSPAEVAGFDRVLVFYRGRLVEDGSPAELAGQPDSRFRALLDRRRVCWMACGGGHGKSRSC